MKEFLFSYDVGVFVVEAFGDGSAVVEHPDGARLAFAVEREAVNYANQQMLARLNANQ